jgi:hypothetical protein
MKFSLPLLAAVAEAAVMARGPGCDVPAPDKDGRYTISAPGIKAQVCTRDMAGTRRFQSADLTAQFIPYGATLTNLFVKDKNGKDVDVVLGYDDVEYYRQSTPHLLAIKGIEF